MTRPDIEGIRARLEKTSAGEEPSSSWTCRGEVDGAHIVWADVYGENGKALGGQQILRAKFKSDAIFSAYAHQDIPALLAYVEELEQQNASLKSYIRDNLDDHWQPIFDIHDLEVGDSIVWAKGGDVYTVIEKPIGPRRQGKVKVTRHANHVTSETSIEINETDGEWVFWRNEDASR